MITEPLFSSHRLKIYPWVKVELSDNDLDSGEKLLELREGESPVIRNWLADLIIMYVVDVGEYFHVIQNKDIPESVSMDELHEIAVTNLARDVEYVLRVTSFGYIITAGGDHEAGIICLDDRWRWLTEHLSDDLLVAIPAKDLVLILPKHDTQKMERFKEFIRNVFRDGDRLLSRALFEYKQSTEQWELIAQID